MEIKRDSNITLLFFTMVVIMLGFGIVIPLIPFYVEELGATAGNLGQMIAVFSVMQFFFSPIWGKLSDRYGRKPILLVGILGYAISLVLFGLSTNLLELFASRALGGILSSATLPTAMAYISDSTPEKDRSGGMGVIGAAQGVGMVLGPGIGGILSKQSMTLPFFLAAAFSLLAFFLVLHLLPESLPPERRDAGGALISLPDSNAAVGLLFGPIGFLLFLAFLMNFGLTSFEGIFGLFAKHRFNYDADEVGYILMVIGIISAIVQGGLTGPVTRRWGEPRVIIISLLFSAVGFVLMLLPTTLGPVLFSVGFFVTSNAMLRPAVATMIANRTREQGQAMGLNNAFMSLGRIAGPVWAGQLFDQNINYPYLSSAVIMALGFGLCLLWLPRNTGASAEALNPSEFGD